MSDPPDYLPDRPLVPSEPLRARLIAGARATLISGGLSAGARVAELISGEQQGLTTSRALDLCALVPSLGIALTYAALGREAGRPSIGKGAWCVLGGMVTVLLVDLATQHVLPGAGQALLWLVIGAGLLLLPALPSLPDARTSALAAAATLTCAAQMLMIAGPFVGIVDGLGVDWEAVAGGVAALFLVASLLWFGASKIRARRRLGGLAALLGWLEIAGVLLSILWVIAGYSIAVAVSMNAGEPEPSEKLMASLDRQINRGIAAGGLLGDLAWTALTAWFFLSIRRRRGPERDFRG